MMIRHEWYKIWHNSRLVAAFLLLVALNCGYFAYRANHAQVTATVYRQLQGDLQELTNEDAFARVQTSVDELKTILYKDNSMTSEKYPRYCGNMWEELSLYTQFAQEYKDASTYHTYVTGILAAPAKYRALQSLFQSNERELRNVEKTAEDFKPLAELTVQRTGTKGISEALSLPSIVFLEILLAILLISVLLGREKERDLLSMYATMANGRGRLLAAKIGAAVIGIVVGNLILLGSVVVTGCCLYGWPKAEEWTMPLQSMAGYRQSALSVSILGFLTLVYLGSVLVSVWFAVLTAFLTIVMASSRMVYLVLFVVVGIEGVLYLRIDEISYLANYKRVNIISFADVAGRLGKYRNIYVFNRPVNDWVLALVVLFATGILLAGASLAMAICGIGNTARKRASKAGILEKNGLMRHMGQHENLFLHEAYKFLRLEKLGLVFILLIVWVLCFTTPYSKDYSIEELHYESFLYQLQNSSKEEYPALVQKVRTELDEVAARGSETSFDRENAYVRLEKYVSYLMSREGATAVNEKGYELLYDSRRDNVIMAALALILVILCATSLYYVEYRTGMQEMIRISYAGRYRVHVRKMILLLISAVIICLAVYGRHVYRVTQSYGTVGIDSAAYSVQSLSDVSKAISLRTFLILTYIKRFAGVLLAGVLSVLIVRKVRSYILSVLAGVAVTVLPLLLGLFEIGLLDKVLLNWFFLC
ncbi:MAG: hypothetical protein IKX54_04000 [Lachnospiraceae bacterium]|nr:hypothetical protein [Lachnospiraceae bacterium]